MITGHKGDGVDEVSYDDLAGLFREIRSCPAMPSVPNEYINCQFCLSDIPSVWLPACTCPAARMLRYRCCLLASDGRVNSRREYVAKDDSEATELARAIYRIYIESVTLGHGFEVWRGVRLVARESACVSSFASEKAEVNPAAIARSHSTGRKKLSYLQPPPSEVEERDTA